VTFLEEAKAEAAAKNVFTENGVHLSEKNAGQPTKGSANPSGANKSKGSDSEE